MFSITPDVLPSHIRQYEAALKRARLDLTHVAATIALMEASEATQPYADIKRLSGATGIAPALPWLPCGGRATDSPVIGGTAMDATGLDRTSRALARSIHLKLVHALRQQHHRGKLTDDGRLRGSRVWALKASTS